MPCRQCKKKVANADRIICRGYCGAEFHVICAKVDMPLLDQLGLHENNVFWMCDECSSLFTNGHFRKVVGRYDDANIDAMKSMKDDIAKLNSAVAGLTATLPPATPTWPIQQRRQIGAKRRLQPEPVEKPDLPKSSIGKKVLSAPIPVIANSPPDDKFWIWLASFPPSVTENDIEAMVKECLSCGDDDSIITRALVKKDVDITTLRSVTFKVGVDKKHRDAALCEDTWPENVTFREFIEFDKKDSSNGSAPGFTKAPRLELPTI